MDDKSEFDSFYSKILKLKKNNILKVAILTQKNAPACCQVRAG